MKIRLHVVVDMEDEALVEQVQSQLSSVCPGLSYSPSRLQLSLANCMEFYCTGEMEEKDIHAFLEYLNSDFDGEWDDCDAYSFNTTMFHPHVYYLQFQAF